jgi:hypothetical protein
MDYLSGAVVNGLTIGEELMHKLGEATVLTEKLFVYPDLSDPGEYRTTFNFGTVTKLNKWLGWQNAFGDIYVTNPSKANRGGLEENLRVVRGLPLFFALSQTSQKIPIYFEAAGALNAFPIAPSARGAIIAYPALLGCNPSSASSRFKSPVSSTIRPK